MQIFEYCPEQFCYKKKKKKGSQMFFCKIVKVTDK